MKENHNAAQSAATTVSDRPSLLPETATQDATPQAQAPAAAPSGSAADETEARGANASAAPEHVGQDAGAALVTIDQFGALDLRVALVLGYERVPKTDKLLKLDVDLGSERRTIVSGIAHLIDPDSLVGRRIIIVANLQPASIRGVESRGMLLAAGGRGDKDAFALATVPDTIPPGTRVS